MGRGFGNAADNFVCPAAWGALPAVIGTILAVVDARTAVSVLREARARTESAALLV